MRAFRGLATSLLLLMPAISINAAPETVAITVDTANPIQTFRPIRTIGTSIDSDPKDHIPLLYSPRRTALMLSTGLGMLTYRLYTELSIQDWHWNPNGRFSDGNQGYWTSSGDLATPITYSYGYRLPHRGSSRDQGDDDNYSRIDDGDSTTYWKSDPYLTHAYTGEPDSANPQWAVVQFLEPHSIDAIRVNWANPYATNFVVQYWTAPNVDPILKPAGGDWKTFAHGEVTGGKGGSTVIKLAASPITTNAVRVWMTASSGTCDTHGSSDPRNCAGYAIEDIGVGRMERNNFKDDVVRSKNGSCHGDLICVPELGRQTLIWTSSDDPWHTQADKIETGGSQTGLDFVARNPMTRGLPTMYPVPVFYSTPANAANEIRYLKARHYPVSYIEMGEEVDGQYALPEDYGALYVQFADAIHKVDPKVKLGGPIFEGVDQDVAVWRDADGDTSWLHRFVNYLKAHGHLGDLAFMSYEHYPYHNCDSGAKLQDDLLDEPSFVRRMAHQWREDGIPPNVPLMETENNFSADGTGASQRVYGALWTGDFIGASLASGVKYMTYYKGETTPLDRNRKCGTWGSYDPYMIDKNYVVHAKGAAYYAIQLLTQQWALPGDREHGVYPVTTSLGDDKAVVTSYALRRPDGKWSVLVVNKDSVARPVSIHFNRNGAPARFVGTVDEITFGDQQYHWNGNGPTDLPNPDRGLKHSTIPATGRFTVPAQSLTVFRGTL